MRLKPTIALVAQGNSAEDISFMKANKSTIFELKANSVNEFFSSVISLGKLFNKQHLAEKWIAETQKTMNQIKENILLISQKKSVNGILLLQYKPFVAFGRASLLGDAFHQLGLFGKNGDNSILKKSYPSLSDEKLLELNLQLMLLPESLSEREKIDAEKQLSKHLKKIVYYNDDMFMRPSPRFLQAILRLGEITKDFK